MKTDSDARATDENRNIMLYWDDANPFPPDIISVAEYWRYVCPAWNVMLFGKDAACSYLSDKFGGDIARLFLTCGMPAMRADFFRVFWAISDGGIYSDMTFAPKREPLFYDPEKDVTLARRSDNGKIMNNIFFSKKNSKELNLVAYEIIYTISEKKRTNIYRATGPAAWMRALWGRDTNDMETSEMETSMIAIINFEKLCRDFLIESGYPSSTRGTEMHWSRQQTRKSIYQDLNENQATSPAENGNAPRAHQKR